MNGKAKIIACRIETAKIIIFDKLKCKKLLYNNKISANTFFINLNIKLNKLKG